MSTERTILKLHTHQALETKCIKRGSPYRTVVCIGGVRSGKSLVIARWMIDRGQWDTAQMHGIFANTKNQLQSILADVMPWVDAAGIEWIPDRRPKPEWIEAWRRKGIRVPPRRTSYRGIMVLSNGLHIQMGSLENRAYTKFKGAMYGSVVVEEVCAGATEEAVRYIFERVNCGIGPAKCKELHHHVRIMHANPPDDDGHWIFDWLTRQEARAAKQAGVEAGGVLDGSFPNLLRGVGDTIYIPSRTIDNAENLPAEFIDDLAGSVDEETAKKILDGVLVRRRAGRAYHKFDTQNEYPINYDPNRTLYVTFDFNTNPTVALLAHPLNEGEYPSDYGSGQMVGVFGEFFHVGGMDAHQMAVLLASGENVGSGGAVPSNWRGIANHKGPVIAFGDTKGGAKQSMTGFTPWSIVNEVLREAVQSRYSTWVGTVNPLQQIKIRSVNGRFCNSRNERHLLIDPRCKELITDLMTVTTMPDGTIKKPGGPRPGSKFWHRTHLSDALGYMVCELFPMGNDKDVRAQQPRIIRGQKRPSDIPSFT